MEPSRQFKRHFRGSAERALRASGYPPMPEPHVAPSPIGPLLPSGSFTLEQEIQQHRDIQREFNNLALDPIPSTSHLRQRQNEKMDRLGASLDIIKANHGQPRLIALNTDFSKEGQPRKEMPDYPYIPGGKEDEF